MPCDECKRRTCGNDCDICEKAEHCGYDCGFKPVYFPPTAYVDDWEARCDGFIYDPDS